MCVAVPGKVISIKNNIAKVDFLGVCREISIELIEGVNIGDYVLAHAGYAMEKLKEEDALDTIDLFKEISEIGY